MKDYRQQELKDIIDILESHGVDIKGAYPVDGMSFKTARLSIINAVEEELTLDKWHPIKERLQPSQLVQGTAKFIDRILRGEV